MLNIKEYWRERDPSEIVHGINVPVDLIERYFPKIMEPGRSLPLGYELLELGAGQGQLSTEIAKRLRYCRVYAVDLNREAMVRMGKVKLEGNEMLLTRTGDATKWTNPWSKESVIKVENFDGVVAQAIMPSLAGLDGRGWKSFLDSVDLSLAPDGYFIQNDFIRGDYYYSPLAKKYGAQTVYEVMGRWKERYDTNAKAFPDKNLPYGGFIVGIPGTMGKELELGSVEDLKRIYPRPGLFERFAYHPNPIEVRSYLQSKLGYKLVEERYDYYHSRGDSNLLTPYSIQVWQKGNEYKYHPLVHGMTIKETFGEGAEFALRMRDAYMQTAGGDYAKYFAIYLSQLACLAPLSQAESIRELADQYLKNIVL